MLVVLRVADVELCDQLISRLDNVSFTMGLVQPPCRCGVSHVAQTGLRVREQVFN